MIKIILLSGLIALSVITNVSAKNVTDKKTSSHLNSMYDMQRGFLTNDKKMTLDSLAKFKKEVKASIGDVDVINKLLPENIKHKSSTALNTANMINRHVVEIEKVLTEKNIRMINRQMRSQKAFLDIQNQCFRCHNLVKDWK